GTCGGGGPNTCGTGTCVPNCAGKACGESDECAGVCAQGTCASGLRCVSGVCACDSTSCTGCCASGAGQPGTDNGACGKGGAACTACSAGGTCVAQACGPGGSIVLFGGGFITNTDDTWEWNGAAWTKKNVTGPSARAGHAMATLNGKVV